MLAAFGTRRQRHVATWNALQRIGLRFLAKAALEAVFVLVARRARRRAKRHDIHHLDVHVVAGRNDLFHAIQDERTEGRKTVTRKDEHSAREATRHGHVLLDGFRNEEHQTFQQFQKAEEHVEQRRLGVGNHIDDSVTHLKMTEKNGTKPL